MPPHVKVSFTMNEIDAVETALLVFMQDYPAGSAREKKDQAAMLRAAAKISMAIARKEQS